MPFETSNTSVLAAGICCCDFEVVTAVYYPNHKLSVVRLFSHNLKYKTRILLQDQSSHIHLLEMISRRNYIILLMSNWSKLIHFGIIKNDKITKIAMNYDIGICRVCLK